MHPPAHPLPARRPKGLAVAHGGLDRLLLVVEVVGRDGDAPPLREGGVGQVEGEDDDDGADGQADVQAGRGQVIEAQPPAAVLAAEEGVEEEADGAPAEVVERGGRGNLRSANVSVPGHVGRFGNNGVQKVLTMPEPPKMSGAFK